ncbi:MAG: DUF2339 domain-containing protein [Pseudomonadota bacterium]
MSLILSMIGAFSLGLLEGFPGVVIGLVLGYLMGMVFELKGRVEQLENRLKTTETNGAAAEPPPSDEPLTEPRVAPAEEPSAPFGASPEAEPGHVPDPESRSKTAPPPLPDKPVQERVDILDYLKSFFTDGNVVVRIGMIVLFFGVAFLLKYAADHNMLPIELRLSGAALGGMVILAVGWRLRLRHSVYALILQGGAIGVVYLTVFAAAKMYGLVPAAFAFVVMIALVALSGVLSVLQDSRSLAIFGAAGGFLAPVLLSTGGGNHVMLFSYYALLNAGILGIAWFKAWRPLNLVGFMFTFVIGATWGYNYYQPPYFSSTEPFLVLFFFFYVAIAVLFAYRQPPQLKGYVDGSLVFGVPLVAFALQSALVKDYEYGLAISALAMSTFYISLASGLWRRKVEGMRMLTEAFLALGVVFGSLAIPLALDGQWTAAAWALEGAALIWIGVRQERVPARLFGLLLQVGAGLSFLSVADDPVSDMPVLNGLYLSCLLISLAGLFSSYYLRRHKDQLRDWEQWFHIPVLVWGLLWWFGGGLNEIEEHLHMRHQTHTILVFIALSCAAMGWIARCLTWDAIRYPPLGLLPAMGLIALASFVFRYDPHPFARWGFCAWAAAFLVHYHLLWRFENDWRYDLVRLWHRGALCLAVFVLTWEAAWAVNKVVQGAGTWKFIAWGGVPGLATLMVLTWRDHIRWPVQRFLAEYLGKGLGILAMFLWLWVLTASFQDGDPWPLPYVPVLNPLELVQVFVSLVMVRWVWQTFKEQIPVIFDLPVHVLSYALAAAVFIWLNAVVARTVHFWGDVPFTWHALSNSVLFQAAVSILWSFTAFGIMAGATRRTSRQVWFVGGTLLGLVVVKLFIVDLDGTGTVARIVSFVAVGILMLVIGYFSPAPPRHKEEIKA